MSENVLPTDLEGVLADTDLHEQYRQFLTFKGKGAADFLLMYDAIADFESKYETDPNKETRNGAARRIILRFLSEGQGYVGIDRTLRDKLVADAYRREHQFDKDAFEVCKTKLMEWMSARYLGEFLIYKKTGKLRGDQGNSSFRVVRSMAHRIMSPVRKAARRPSKYLRFGRKEPSKSRDGSSDLFLFEKV